MKHDFAAAMGRALERTRAGDAAEASRIIQAAIKGSTPPTSEKVRALPQPVQPEIAAPDGAGDTTTGSGASPKPVIDLRHRVGDGRQSLREVVQALRRGRPGAQPSDQPGARDPAPPAHPPGARWEIRNFTSAAGARTYALYAPKTARENPAGVVLMLHGCTQTGVDCARGTRMNELAERHGLIVAYPEQTRSHNAQSVLELVPAGRPGSGQRRARDTRRDSLGGLHGVRDPAGPLLCCRPVRRRRHGRDPRGQPSGGVQRGGRAFRIAARRRARRHLGFRRDAGRGRFGAAARSACPRERSSSTAAPTRSSTRRTATASSRPPRRRRDCLSPARADALALAEPSLALPSGTPAMSRSASIGWSRARAMPGSAAVPRARTPIPMVPTPRRKWFGSSSAFPETPHDPQPCRRCRRRGSAALEMASTMDRLMARLPRLDAEPRSRHRPTRGCLPPGTAGPVAGRRRCEDGVRCEQSARRAE